MMIQEIIPPVEPTWLASFGLSDRVATPDLFLSREDVRGAAHAGAMRLGFDLGVSGYLCVGTVPTVAFLIRDTLDQAEVDRIHKALWNQGLASLLLVAVSNAIRVYSLWRRPVASAGRLSKTQDKRLVEVLAVLLAQVDLVIPAVEAERSRQVLAFRDHS